MRCGEIFSDSAITNFLLLLTVKEFSKSVNIWLSSGVQNIVPNFFGHPVQSASTNTKDSLLCSHIIGRIMRLGRPSVCLSVSPVRARNSKRKKNVEKIGTNVQQETSKWSVNF